MGECEKLKKLIDKKWAKTYNVVSCLTSWRKRMRRYILFQIKQFQNRVVRNICIDMKKFDITSPPSLIQSEIIGYLIQNETQDIYQKDLEAIFQLRRSTISGVLQTLEKKNLIKRTDIPNDARMKKIILTNEAKDLYKSATRYLEKLEKKVITGIEKDELEIFYKVLDKMQHNLDVE